MAIVEMKHLSLLALQSDKERMMRAMQRAGCVQLTPLEEEEPSPGQPNGDLTRARDNLSRLSWAINRLRKFDTAGKPMFGCMPEITEEEAESTLSDEEKLMGTVKRLEEIEAEIGQCRSETARIEAARASLEPWEKLDLKKSQLSGTADTVCFAGSVQTRRLEEMKSALAGLPAVTEEEGVLRDMTCLCVIAHKSAGKDVSAALTGVSFTSETFSSMQEEESPKDALNRLKREEEEIAKRRADSDKETEALAGDLPRMKILCDALTIKASRLEKEGLSIQTQKAFYMEGWIPAQRAQKLCDQLKKISPACSVETRDPLDEEEPPVALSNGKFATPFESVVEGFALPAYRSYDPTAIMAPFYACLFGMMVSDAGYGLLMAIVIPLFIKWKKIKFENAKMLYLLTWGGVFTFIWGLIYNTVFGYNPLPVTILDSVNNSLPVMVVCIAVGALHLFTGLGIAAWLNIKKGDWLAALADQIAWMTLLCGLVMLVLPATAQIGTIMAIVSVAIILCFTRRDTWNPIKRLIKGLSALYGITSWVSDLLSYMRLFGMGLATGVIGMVFNQLISMVMGGGAIGVVIGCVLFVFCHLFNLAINVLGAYVHSCRLQYIEFFGKFYEEGGKPFMPLNEKTKYVSIRRDAA